MNCRKESVLPAAPAGKAAQAALDACKRMAIGSAHRSWIVPVCLAMLGPMAGPHTVDSSRKKAVFTRQPALPRPVSWRT